MAKRTTVGKGALWALVGGCILPVLGSAQAFETKSGFSCRIELPSGSYIDTTDSAKVCATTYVSITCLAEVDSGENPATTRRGDDCSINTAICGDEEPEQPQPAVQSKLTIAADGTTRLNCLFLLSP